MDVDTDGVRQELQSVQSACLTHPEIKLIITVGGRDLGSATPMHKLFVAMISGNRRDAGKYGPAPLSKAVTGPYLQFLTELKA
ncbi:hypothetical protein HDU89_000963 [Geranomyces variabilis]|nr:hypothetical protein HDU89_000963 [Geranomyces variabilis]